MPSFETKWDTINVDSVKMSIQVSSGTQYNNGAANLTLSADEMGKLIVFLKKSRAMLLAVSASKNLQIQAQDEKEVVETKEQIKEQIRNIIVSDQTVQAQ
jgi:hypothetical protein